MGLVPLQEEGETPELSLRHVKIQLDRKRARERALTKN